MVKRRQLIKGLGATPLLLGAAAALRAQITLTSVDLGNGMHLIQGAGSNVVVAVGAEAVVVVDGGSAEHADALLSEITRIAGSKPITALFNTNWRPSHSGLNHLLGPTGTKIIAHENTRLWQNADFHVEWEAKDYSALPKAAQANATFYTAGSLQLGDEVMEYGIVSQCNTDGDIYVHFTKADVLVVGDMLNSESFLMLDYVTGGWITGAQKTTAGLIARSKESTKVIAATGGVQGKPHLEAQAAMLTVAYDTVAKAFQTGRSLEQYKESDPMKDFRATLGVPDLFLALLYKGTWYHVPGRAVRNII